MFIDLINSRETEILFRRGSKKIGELFIPNMLPFIESTGRDNTSLRLKRLPERWFFVDSLQDYINLKQLRVEVDDFRNLMGIQPGQYQYFTMLRKRVLDKSIEEINEKTDIEVNFDLETEGRKFTAIVFQMKVKEQSSLQHDTHSQIIEKLISLGVKRTRASQLLEKHDEQYLRANISIVEEQVRKGKIKNVTAYLLKAFEHDFRPTVTELDQLRAEKETAERERQTKIEEKRRAEEEQKKSFEAERRKNLEEVISGLSAEELDQLREEFSDSLSQTPVMEKILKTKGIDNPMLQPQRENFLAERFLASYFHRFVSYDKKRAGSREE